jgi:translation initiation factor IF-2
VSKVRVYAVAKELGVSSKELVERLHGMGVEVKSAQSTIDDDVIARLKGDGGAVATQAPPAEAPATEAPRAEAPPEPVSEAPKPPAPGPKAEAKRQHKAALKAEPVPEPEPEPAGPSGNGEVHVHRGVTVKEFAEKAGMSGPDVIKALMRHGAMKSITQSMTDEEILVVADDLGVTVEIVDPEVEERLEAEASEAEVPAEALSPRPAVVTVMGHVDHGKTTLLDRIRQADVVAHEHGGITQHIGAYQVTKDGERVTFIDTPGHQAFTAMRARGAQVTDIAVLVVAADDGVMPQTVEAIDHARAAGVPIIVAVNKVDKPEADPNRARTELSDHGLQPQEWGGDTLFVDVSAKSGQGLDDLLTGVLLVSEDLALKAVGEGPARGIVLEAHLDKGRGPVGTVLVRQGRLKIGDVVVAGTAWGKVRAMLDEYGEQVEEADPGRPVLVLGWSSVPDTGDEVRVVKDERQGRQIAQEREANRRHADLVSVGKRFTLDELLQETEELSLILKADVRGSLEAVTDELAKMDVGGVKASVIHRAVGAITESDVDLARASNAIIVGFNVRPDAKARQVAEAAGVEIRTYQVIYELLDEMDRAMRGMLAPEFREQVLGAAEVRDTFKVKRFVIAGCFVTNGEIVRGAKARLLRDGAVIHDGTIGSLRRFKDDVRNVQQGFECGIGLEGYTDIKVGDVIEAYELREVSPT